MKKLHENFKKRFRKFHKAIHLIIVLVIGIIAIWYFKDDITTLLSQHVELSGKAAFIRNDNLWVVENNNQKQLTKDAIHAEIPYESGLAEMYYGNPQVSPDGRMVAFLKSTSDNTYTSSLYVINMDGTNMRKLTNDVSWVDHTLQWGKDSNTIFYNYLPLGQTPMIGDTNKIYSIKVGTKEKNEVGRYVVETGGCGGGSSDMSAHVAEGEGLGFYGMYPSVFQVSTKNNLLIHTVNCFGTGINVLDIHQSADMTISQDGTQAVISGDGNIVAAIHNSDTQGNIDIIDARSGNFIKNLPTSTMAADLLWSSDNKALYFVSREKVKTLTLPQNNSLVTSGDAYEIYTSTIRKISLDTGIETKIADFNAWAIRLLFVNPDQSRMIVSEVENSTNLYNYLLHNTDKKYFVQNYPKVNLLELNLKDGTSKTVLKDSMQASYIPN